MLSSAFTLAFADLRIMLRRRETWFWVFLMPVIFFYFIGTITAHWGGEETADPIAVFEPPTAGFLAADFVARLERANYHTFRVASAAELQRYSRSLEFPANFTQAILAHTPVEVKIKHPESQESAQYDEVRLGRAVYTLLADLTMAARRGATLNAAALAQIEATPRTMVLKQQAAGKRHVIPSGFEQAVPGSMVFFVLLSTLTSGGVTLVVERQTGILRRLASAPISRGGVVAGKWGARMLLAAIQIAFAMVTGAVLFHVHWGAQLPMVLAVLAAYAAFASGAGVLVGSLSRTPGQAAAFGSIASNVMAALGGCWWPVEIMPRAMQSLAAVTPPGITMRALHRLVNFGEGPQVALVPLAVLLALALIAGYSTARSFRFQ